MGDAVSWTALGATVPIVISLVAMAFSFGKLSGKVDNGLSGSIKSINEKLDRLPCLQPHCPTEESPSPEVRARTRQ